MPANCKRPRTSTGGTISYLEESFDLWIRQENVNPNECFREFQFVSDRKWRFDFAWPKEMVAVEIDGLKHDGKGGHQTVQGVLADAEKYEAALRMGWRVYRVPGPWVAEGERMIWRPQVMETLKELLGIDG